MSTEIPYWLHVTAQIWEVLLIGYSKFPLWCDQSLKYYPDLGAQISHVQLYN